MANIITVSRLLLIPFFLYFMFSSPPQNLLATIVFVAAALTDTLDGYVARRLDQVTELGKKIDPLTDRIFIVTAVIALYLRDSQPPLFALAILLVRELFLLYGYLYLNKRGKQLPVSFLGKTATTILMTAFAFMIFGYGPGLFLFYIGLFLYIISALDYARFALRMIYR